MRIIATLDGGKKVTAHLENGMTVPTDQPRDEGGGESAPTPVDLFLCALATCAGVYVEDFCTHRGIPVDRIRLVQDAGFVRGDDGKIRLGTVSLTIELPADFPEKYRDAVKRVAELCTVKRIVEHPPTFGVETRVV